MPQGFDCVGDFVLLRWKRNARAPLCRVVLLKDTTSLAVRLDLQLVRVDARACVLPDFKRLLLVAHRILL